MLEKLFVHKGSRVQKLSVAVRDVRVWATWAVRLTSCMPVDVRQVLDRQGCYRPVVVDCQY
jgi:hypothetical protein